MAMNRSQKNTNGEYHGFLLSNGEANHLITVHEVASGTKANDSTFHTSLDRFVLAGLDHIADQASRQSDGAGPIPLESLSGDPALEPLDPYGHELLKTVVVPLDEEYLRTVDALAAVGGGRSRSDVLRVAAWAAVTSVLADPDMDEKWEQFGMFKQQTAANLEERIAAAADTDHVQL